MELRELLMFMTKKGASDLHLKPMRPPLLRIGGNLTLANGIYPFNIPVLFPNGIPAIVFSAIVGILMNVIFLIFKKD